MTKEAYVHFETAKLLKEKGFDWGTQYVYTEDGAGCTPPKIGKWKAKSNIPMVTHQMACAWLRKKGYHIAVIYQSKFKTWERIIQASTGVNWSLGGFDSHDEAVEETIKYVLENLI